MATRGPDYFDRFNSGGGLQPVRVLNRLRDYAYPLSQRAWARAGGHGDAQRCADIERRQLHDRP